MVGVSDFSVRAAMSTSMSMFIIYLHQRIYVDPRFIHQPVSAMASTGTVAAMWTCNLLQYKCCRDATNSNSNRDCGPQWAANVSNCLDNGSSKNIQLDMTIHRWIDLDMSQDTVAQ